VVPSLQHFHSKNSYNIEKFKNPAKLTKKCAVEIANTSPLQKVEEEEEERYKNSNNLLTNPTRNNLTQKKCMLKYVNVLMKF
jgi:hypothetical protein